MPEGERLAKRLAGAGLCSRREAEEWIKAGRVQVGGRKITTPAFNVSESDAVKVDGKLLQRRKETRLWLYHKPVGLMTTHKDPQGRPTVFDALPRELGRVISVGRLDLNSEGLLLLTNDGALARKLELPSTGWIRRYRVRVFGNITPAMLAEMKKGVVVDGVHYGSVEAALDSQKGDNSWLTVALKEGKNREIRKIFEHFSCKVSRLLRLSYGPFQLGGLPKGEVKEVSGKVLKSFVGDW
ncbi:MAG: rRNA pseudouridine synthase [Pseudomonadota bacterium]|nr:rRNA pseudouridine synthase [Pseudomonadota bacterium]